jgi:hypothetical protein
MGMLTVWLGAARGAATLGLADQNGKGIESG